MTLVRHWSVGPSLVLPHAEIVQTARRSAVGFNMMTLPLSFVSASEYLQSRSFRLLVDAKSIYGCRICINRRFVVSMSVHPFTMYCPPLFSNPVNRATIAL